MHSRDRGPAYAAKASPGRNSVRDLHSEAVVLDRFILRTLAVNVVSQKAWMAANQVLDSDYLPGCGQPPRLGAADHLDDHPLTASIRQPGRQTAAIGITSLDGSRLHRLGYLVISEAAICVSSVRATAKFSRCWFRRLLPSSHILEHSDGGRH